MSRTKIYINLERRKAPTEFAAFSILDYSPFTLTPRGNANVPPTPIFENRTVFGTPMPTLNTNPRIFNLGNKNAFGTPMPNSRVFVDLDENIDDPMEIDDPSYQEDFKMDYGGQAIKIPGRLKNILSKEQLRTFCMVKYYTSRCLHTQVYNFSSRRNVQLYVQRRRNYVWVISYPELGIRFAYRTDDSYYKGEFEFLHELRKHGYERVDYD